ADLVAAKARVQVAEAEAARVDALRQYKYLRAPFDGKVTRRTVHTGHYLQPSASNAMPPFTVAQTDKVRVVSEIPEGEAAYVSDGMPVTVRVQTLSNRELAGKLTRTSWSLSAK